MAEVDPMVQAFLKARTKNQREDVKLQRYLTNLELRKSNTKAFLDEQLFEHRRIAFELRKEADLNNSKAKFLPSNEGTDSVFGSKMDRASARPARIEGSVTFENIDGQDETKGTMVTILSQRKDEVIGGDREETIGGVIPALRKNENDIMMRPRLASSISFPPVWKTPSAKLRDTGSEDVGDENSNEKQEEIKPTKDKNKDDVSQCWMGDPMAIGSVRRPRKSTKELIAREDSRASLRTASRELRQFATCSRNCGKSQFINELERCFADIPLLLPAIIAERERRAQEVDRLKRDRSVSEVSQDLKSEVLPCLTNSAPPQSKRSHIGMEHRQTLVKQEV